MQKEKISQDFLDLSENSSFQQKINELNNEEFKQSLINLRKQYSEEMAAPGCRPCKQAALKRKYLTALESTINKYENNS
ncbi:MAG: hypothetical protein VX343_04110 [Thermodesulfobacteriota bacterium]|nr:hypothetical protein [Thermodesulfobacteriota bacterium]